MGSVLVSAAGRSDQEGVRHVEQFPEALQNENAAPSPDRFAYEAYPNRCVATVKNGSRCRGKRLPGRNLCMVHWSADEQE